MQPDSGPLRKLVPATQLLDRLGKPPAFFSRMRIAQKMLLGYAILAALTLVVAGYALFNLRRIIELNRTIVKVDVVIQESSAKMMDALLAMDAYEKRFLLLGTDDMVSLFLKRKREFDASLQVLQSLPRRGGGLALGEIEELGRTYTSLFSREVSLVKERSLAAAREISDGELKVTGERLTTVLRAQAAGAKQAEESRMERLGSVSSTAFLTTVVLCSFSMLLGAVASLLVTHYVSSSVLRLTEATDHYAEGDFAFDPRITTGDEIGILSRAFLAMGRRLSKLEELHLDASPLTRLPGGVAIEREMQKRLDSGSPLAFCWIDLSNFKAFNDRYGYARGNEVIKQTAAILEKAVRSKGTPEDFLGHVGGDDFAVLTAPAAKQELAGEIIAQFDRRVPDFYDPPERKQGYILGRTRQGAEVRFPLMTVSIAIVTNERRKLATFFQVSSIAAELKEQAKTHSQSSFVIDRRRGP